MKPIAGLVVSGLAVAAALPAHADESRPRAVLELFTSQGCSSCPAADALMNKLAVERNLVALSFPVDYWDYLGWKDTAARPEFSARQRGYAASRGDRAIYTPQVVVNGREHVVGSDQAAIERSIDTQATKFGQLPVETRLEAAGDTLTARIGAVPPSDAGAVEYKGTVWLVVYDYSKTVPIARGENKGRTIVYSNVVSGLQPIGMWKGKAMTIDLPRHDLARTPETGLAVLLQVDRDGKPGPILGAAVLARPGS